MTNGNALARQLGLVRNAPEEFFIGERVKLPALSLGHRAQHGEYAESDGHAVTYYMQI